MANQVRDIKYLNRDFASFKQALLDFAQTYFPTTYNDFSDADPATMFIEQASYIGDVLSFYQDNQLQEALLLYAQEKNNLLALAYALGYRPKVTSTSNALLFVYQLIPDDGGGNPDYRYALSIDKGATVQSVSNPSVSFITQDTVNFAFSSSFDPTISNVYQIDPVTTNVQYHLLQKTVKGVAGSIKTQTFSFGSPQKFQVVNIQDDNIIQITDVTDSDGNKWEEVPFLAQSTIFTAVSNNEINDPNFLQYKNTTPYLLRLKKVPRRFVTRFRTDSTMEIEFGAGVLSVADEIVIPNPDNVGLGVVDNISKINLAFDPSNFLFTKDYGIAPANTQLTFTYLVGGGVQTNVPSNDITKITGMNANPVSTNVVALNQNLLNQVVKSVAFNNPSASVGGGSGDSVDDIKNNTLGAFPAQLRCVTTDDYAVRALSLPSEFGTVAKVYIVQDQTLNSQIDKTDFIDNNPLALSMYILAFNQNKDLVQGDLGLKTNLKTYLDQFRMLTDAITIKDAFYINFKVYFEIVVLPGNNEKEILTNCITAVEDFFNIDKWQINQPIVLSDIYILLAGIKGVQNVKKVRLENVFGADQGYSPYGYDIQGATIDGVIFPSLDPSVFECRYPSSDIYGKVVTL
jgi:hypothetical protein